MTDLLTLALSRLNPTDHRIARRHLTEIEVGTGENITHRGDSDPAIAWVRSGEVELRVQDHTVHTVGPGGVIGAEDLGASRRTFSAVVASPAQLVLAEHRDLERLRTEVPSVAAVLELGALRTVASLLRSLDRRVLHDTRSFLREYDPTLVQRFPVLSTLGAVPSSGAPASWASPVLPPMLNNLPTSLRVTAREGATGLKLRAGQLLVLENEPADAVFFVVEGRLVALASVDEVSVRLGEIGPDTIVGATSVLTGEHHLATCMAVEPVSVIRLDAAFWTGLLAVEAEQGSALRIGVLHAISQWIPLIRDRVECSERCLRGVIHAQLFDG